MRLPPRFGAPLRQQIARIGRPGDRLRAAEFLGRQMGMFREKPVGEREMSFADLVLAASVARSSGLRSM
jgi:hypothetical protein